MKFWRKKRRAFGGAIDPSFFKPAGSIMVMPTPLEHPLDATEEVTLQPMIDEIEALGRRLAALELAAHDHCEHCGAMTPRYGLTECGRAECRQGAA